MSDGKKKIKCVLCISSAKPSYLAKPTKENVCDLPVNAVEEYDAWAALEKLCARRAEGCARQQPGEFQVLVSQRAYSWKSVSLLGTSLHVCSSLDTPSIHTRNSWNVFSPSTCLVLEHPEASDFSVTLSDHRRHSPSAWSFANTVCPQLRVTATSKIFLNGFGSPQYWLIDQERGCIFQVISIQALIMKCRARKRNTLF